MIALWKMRKAYWIAGIFSALAIISLFWALKTKKADSSSLFEFVLVTRGDIQAVVSCTGTLNPVGKVEVGTQVSGTVDRLLADFNSKVVQNQVLAILDTSLLSLQVQDAGAAIIKDKAQYDLAAREFQNSQQLFENKHISELDLEKQRVQMEMANSAYISSKLRLEIAGRNLKYAVIRSPINGTVIYRNVEQGQTVSASLSAPTLFVIAKDLSKMEIQAYVDETDIGKIKQGQEVRFSVDSHSDKKFNCSVRQIWLQPATIQNVVNYTVIIDAENPENLLLPGMTATVDFIIRDAKNVLMVPNAALRFRPGDVEMAEFRKQMQSRNSADSLKKMDMGRRSRNRSDSAITEEGEGRQRARDTGRLWYLDPQGKLKVARIRSGATDGKNTEIIQGRDVAEGMRVIGGQKKVEKSTMDRNAGQNPFQGGPPMGGMGFGGGGGFNR